MAVTFMTFKANHLKYIDVQDAQRDGLAAMLEPGQADMLETGIALSAWDRNRCLGAAGFVNVYRHRAMAWALLSKDAGGYMLPIVRKVRRVLELDPTKRIEMYVKSDFVAGHVFARAVGMKQETGVLRMHGALGEDEVMYSRIK